MTTIAVAVSTHDDPSPSSNTASATSTVQAPALPIRSAPVITGLSPASAKEGDRRLTLVVNGSNFAPGAVVLFDGRPVTTTFISATSLEVPNLLKQVGPSVRVVRRRGHHRVIRLPGFRAGTASITVLVPGQDPSPAVSFTVRKGRHAGRANGRSV